MNKLLSALFILVFLSISVMADVLYVKSNSWLFFAYGAMLVILSTGIVHGWLGNRKLSLFTALAYILVFIPALAMRQHALDTLLGMHRSDAILNTMLEWMKSPLPLMLLLAIASLKRKEQNEEQSVKKSS
jgi:hypothetical protein